MSSYLITGKSLVWHTKKYIFPKLPILSTTGVDFGFLQIMILVPSSSGGGGGGVGFEGDVLVLGVPTLHGGSVLRIFAFDRVVGLMIRSLDITDMASACVG